MLKIISKISEVLKQVAHFNFILNKEEGEYRNYLKNHTPKLSINSTSNILLVPLIDDLGTMKIVIDLANKIAGEDNLQIKYFFLHSYIDNKRYETKLLAPVLNYLTTWSYISINRLLKVYNIKRSQLIMSNYFAPGKIGQQSQFENKREILALKYNDVEIGDLLYDTYLRFQAKPTIDVADSNLYVIKSYILKLAAKWDAFFNKYNVTKVIMPYAAYHHWGIPAKLALKHNVEVITFGSNLYIFQQLKSDYQYHTKNFNFYPQIFELLNDKEKCKQQAKLALDNRLSGKIDKAISYMKKSAFDKTNSVSYQFPQNKKWAVIFLHCFFDSPHIYGDGLFVDFYEWLNHLLTQASQNPGVIYFVKSHPNGLPENVLVVEDFTERFSAYKNIIFLSKDVSNTNIMESHPNAIFTYYGTVAHEFAYFGIPAITCGENPHSKYDFVYNTKSIEELDYFLKNVGEFGLPDKYNKEDVLEFFYMHYIYYAPKYNRLNFELVKNMITGELNIPDAITNDLIYKN